VWSFGWMDRREGWGKAATLLIGVFGLLVFFVPPAGAVKTHVLLGRLGGSTPPTVKSTAGLAWDSTREDILVVETGGGQAGAGAIARFNADGTPDDFSALGTNRITGLSFRVGAGGWADQLAVDNSGTLTNGDIYVTQGLSHRVNVYNSAGEQIAELTGGGGSLFEGQLSPCGVAVGPSGQLYVGSGGPESKLFTFIPTGNSPFSVEAVAVPSEVETPCTLGAGAGANAGALFTSFEDFALERAGFAKLSAATGALDYEFPQTFRLKTGSQRLAVDPVDGNVYVGSSGEFEHRQPLVREFDVSGGSGSPSLVSTFEPEVEIEGIAVDPTTGHVYLSELTEIQVFSALITVPEVITSAAEITGETEATLKGEVDPDGVALEECAFEYGTTAALGQVAPCKSPNVSEIGGSTTTVRVHADLSGLDPETTYHFRLIAKNGEQAAEGAPATAGAERAFKTPSKPTMAAEWAGTVARETATVQASINPENVPTTYYVEWGADTSYGHRTAVAEVGDDATEHTVSSRLEALNPGSTYHYRFVAVNRLGEAEGSDHAFTTFRFPTASSGCANESFRTGASAALPDCRAFEMVSDAEADGGDILPMINISRDRAALDQATPDGGALTYTTYRAFGDSVSAPYAPQYIASRTDTGWQTQAISPPQETSIEPVPFLDSEFRAFSPDLCEAWLFHAPDTAALANGAIQDYANLYRRQNCGGVSYEALTAPNPRTLVPKSTLANFKPELQGVALEGEGAVFAADAKLTEEAASGFRQTYDFTGGKLHLVCLLPSGGHYAGNCSAGAPNTEFLGLRTGSVLHALSEDGSRIYWTAGGESKFGPGTIYLRTNPGKAQSKIVAERCTEAAKACTLPVSESVSPAKAHFVRATPDGSEALFEIEDGSSPLNENLYEYDAVTEESTLLAGKVFGILGAAEDLSRIYVVSGEALAGSAVSGEANLYLYEPSASVPFRFIATLSASDVGPTTLSHAYTATTAEPYRHMAQVTGDGDQATFVSSARLTEYDNTDQISGEADGEVYLYDATADGGAGRLVCASCNPSGSRPLGQPLEFEERLTEQWASAYLAPAETLLYAPRVLTDHGKRLFFTSYEALQPEDTDNARDVYEWEAPGAGTCTTMSGSYSEQDAGCVQLISSGQGAGEATFIDADEEGGNVFFTTGESLVPEDEGMIDIYDARVEGSVPASSASHVECEGASCQQPTPAPAGPALGSSSGQAEGNVSPRKPRCPKGRRTVRRKGKQYCVKPTKRPRQKSHGRKGNDSRAKDRKHHRHGTTSKQGRKGR
jgi:DNA-binding beta-propeller fold protein YncE